MEWLLGSQEGRTILLLLSGIGLLLQLDNLIEAMKARKEGDDPSEEEASPPDG